ncbi:MAG: cyclic nucleotide-binding domain-containing protein, partial [Anaerolineae bacterium]
RHVSSYRTQKHNTDPFLDKLDPKSLADFLASLATINLSAGEVVFRENDPPDVHYHIKDGTIVLTEGDETINTLGSGDGFGGTALISDLPRSVTAAARTDATLYKIPRDRFAEVIATQPGVATQIYDLLAQQVRRAMFTTVLRRIIGDFDAELLAAIEPYVSWRLFEPGETIFAQDTIGEEIYVIAAGRVRVTYDNGVRDRVLGEVGGSDFFGEMAILGDSVRTATVTALRETTTASITAEGFQKLMAESPAFASQVMQTIVQRLRGTMNRAHVHKPLSLNLSMVAASPGVDLEGFVADLMPFLQKHGSAIAVTRESFSKRYGLDHNLDQIPDILIRLWMNELEYMHNYVIYIADDDWSMWTNLITRGTDRVLFVGEAQGGPQPDDLARTISAEVPNQHFELILLHAPETRKPEGTAAWLDAYPVVRHHHVRKQDGAHFARVARLLTGNGIGLVMGGGGARGYAHIGVWRALMEAQVPVDAIGCVSMGAVVGGGFLDAMSDILPTPKDGGFCR